MSWLPRAHVVARKLGWRLSRLRRRVSRPQDLPAAASFVVVSYSHELSHTQVYPFHLHADALEERHGARLHEISIEDFDAADARERCPQVRWLAFQTGFDLSDAQMQARLAKLRAVFPNARLSYLDFFAPLDLRYAAVLDPWITHYVKKQAFADFSQYGRSTLGDTNLTDYYAARFGLDKPRYCFAVPEGFEAKLRIGSNFCVSPHMIDRFRGPLPDGDRPIDVHARIATRGTDWYRLMREEARDTARAVAGVHTVSEGRVSQARFFEELAASKVCFSPFGYGEVCWRDYEAVFSGAVLLKPRMDHVRLSPSLFVADETYVPLEWDCADYEERLRAILADAPRRREIARNAFERVRDYLRSDQVLDEIGVLFQDAAGGSP